MRFYTTAESNDCKTVKAQGLRVALAWKEQTGIQVQVKSIKRIGNTAPHLQWGFIVLESIFGADLCFYKFDGATLSVRDESSLVIDEPQHLQCPEPMLAKAETANGFWRECVRTYTTATRHLSSDRLAQNATLFLMKPYAVHQYSEPFFVLQKQAGEWFGIDCYGERKYLTPSICEIHEHCPVLIDLPTLRPMDVSGLASDCVNTGLVIYKEDGNRAHLLGRPKTRLEKLAECRSVMPRVRFDLHGEVSWA